MDIAQASAILTAPADDDLSVVFCTPALSANVCLEYKNSMMQTVMLLGSNGIPHGVLDRAGDAYLDKVRSKLATEFLESFPTAQNFFFLDDDIGWPAYKVIEFLRRPEPILAGIYPKKSDEIDFPVEFMVNTETGELIERDGLYRVGGIPTGFLRIKRWALEKLVALAPRFKCMEPGNVVREYAYVFPTGIGPDGWFWGEDYAMARNWLETGGEIWVDPDIEFTHRGTKKWANNLSRHLDKYREKAQRDAANIRAQQEIAAKEKAA